MSAERVELVCSNCGEAGRLYREVTVEGWEAVNVYRGEARQNPRRRIRASSAWRRPPDVR